MSSSRRSITGRRVATIAAFGAAAVLLTGLGGAVHAQQPQTDEVKVLRVRPNVYMLVGAGANIVVHIGWMGALVVDTGSADKSAQVLAAIKRLTDKPIRFITNTTAGSDHVGGNAALAKSGQNLLRRGGNFGGGGARNGLDLSNDGAAGIMGHENVLRRMSAPTGQRSPFSVLGWPTEVYSGTRSVSLYLNGDGVQMIYQPAAHSDADSFIYFRRADVIAAGDILDLRHFPVIDVENGGTINGLIDALTRLIELSIPPAPFVWHEDRTLIVPGHGRLADQGDVVEYRDMLTIIRDRVQDLMNKGMMLEQVKKANPTHGYDRLYGRDTGPWTTAMFVSAVYRTLGGK